MLRITYNAPASREISVAPLSLGGGGGDGPGAGDALRVSAGVCIGFGDASGGVVGGNEGDFVRLPTAAGEAATGYDVTGLGDDATGFGDGTDTAASTRGGEDTVVGESTLGSRVGGMSR